MKKLNILLLKYIIKTDFFIFENKKSFPRSKILNSISTKNFNVLNIIELIFSLKQQIRLLQFAKKKNFEINIIDSNYQNLKIVEIFYHKLFDSIENKIFFKDYLSQDLKKNNLLQLFILLNVKNTLKKNMLIAEINTFSQLLNTNNYKLFNNVNSLKKFTVFLNVLYNILKKVKK